jgi:hypothetical protein
VVGRFGHEFFDWWREQLVSIEDFPYEGIGFHHDLELELPLGAQWGPLSKN